MKPLNHGHRVMPIVAWACLFLASQAHAEDLKPVQAIERWNDTAIQVQSKELVKIEASGTWRDLHRNTGAEGYRSDNPLLFLTTWLRRKPTQKWFALIACVDRRHCKPVTNEPWEAPASGRLSFYANDVWIMYGNNRGCLDLRVTTSNGAASTVGPCPTPID